jgi:hypothetical protein
MSGEATQEDAYAFLEPWKERARARQERNGQRVECVSWTSAARELARAAIYEKHVPTLPESLLLANAVLRGHRDCLSLLETIEQLRSAPNPIRPSPEGWS